MTMSPATPTPTFVPSVPPAAVPRTSGPEWLAPSPDRKRETVDLFGSLVRDIMTTKVETLAPGDTLRFAATVLTDKRISGAPVVDPDGKVVGVLSEKDIVRQLKDKAGLAFPGGLFELILEPSAARRADLLSRCVDTLNDITVGVAMSKPAHTIRADAPSIEAVRDMLVHRINRLPVVERGRLVGIVTRTDVLRLGQST